MVMIGSEETDAFWKDRSAFYIDEVVLFLFGLGPMWIVAEIDAVKLRLK